MSQISPNWLKDFLYDRPIYSFCALLIIAIVWVLKQWRKSESARIEDLKLILPLANRLEELNTQMVGLFDRISSRRSKPQTQAIGSVSE